MVISISLFVIGIFLIGLGVSDLLSDMKGQSLRRKWQAFLEFLMDLFIGFGFSFTVLMVLFGFLLMVIGLIIFIAYI